MSNQGTTISNINPVEGALVRGIFTMSADVTDPIGIIAVDFSVDGGSTQSAPNPAAPAVDINSALFVDGSHVFAIDATNSVSTVSSAAVSYLVDNTLPSVSLDGITEGMSFKGAVSVTGAVSDANGIASAILYFDGLPHTTFTDFSSIATIVNTIGMADGQKTISLVATDNAGNANSVAYTIIVDNTDPSVSIISPIDGQSFSSSFLAISNISDIVGIARMEYKVDGVHYGYAPTNSPSELEINITTYADGPHTLTAIATDAAGNTGTATITFVIDRAAPVLASPTVDGWIEASLSCRLSGSVADATTNLTALNINGRSISVVGKSHFYTYDVAISGSTPFNVSATDSAGNVNTLARRVCKAARAPSCNFC